MKLTRLVTTIATSMLLVASANATPISFGFLESDFEQDALWANFSPTSGSVTVSASDFGAVAGTPSNSFFAGSGRSSLNAFGGGCSPAGMLQFQPSGSLCSDKLGGARTSGGRFIFVDGNGDEEVEEPTRPIPEPGTLLMFGIGLFALGLFGRRRENS